MAGTQFDLFEDLAQTTIQNWDRDTTESISQHNGLLREMKRRGKFVSKSGGNEMWLPVMLDENRTIQNYFPGGKINTTAGPTITNAKYPWSLKSQSVVAYGYELRVNMGRQQIIDLVQQRLKQADLTAANRIAIELYADGSITGSFAGLKGLISDNGMGTVGTINSSNYTNWQSKFLDVTIASLTPATIRRYFSQLELKLTFGAKQPNLIVATNDIYLTYEDAVVQQIRYMDEKQAEGSVTSIKHKNITVMHDVNVDFAETDQVAFFLNVEDMEVWQHPQAKMDPESKRIPYDQDSIVIPYFGQYGFGLSGRRYQGKFLTH
jgi:hypothetical protein